PAPRLAARLRRARFPADALVLAAEVPDRLVGVEVKDGSAGGGPAAAVEGEDGRGVAQVADGGQALHVGALHRLQGDGPADEAQELAGPPVAGQLDARVPLAPRPAQAARLAGSGRRLEECRLQVLALPAEQLAGVRRRHAAAPELPEPGQHGVTPLD